MKYLGWFLIVAGALVIGYFFIIPLIAGGASISDYSNLNLSSIVIFFGPLIAGVIMVRSSHVERQVPLQGGAQRSVSMKIAIGFIVAGVLLFLLLLGLGLHEELTGITLFPESALILLVAGLGILLFTIGFVVLLVGWIISEIRSRNN